MSDNNNKQTPAPAPETDALAILFEGAAQAGGVTLANSPPWAPKEGGEPVLLAVFRDARVIPVADGESWRPGLLVELETHRGVRLGWWPPSGTAVQLLRAVGAGSQLAQGLIEAEPEEIDGLGHRLGPYLENLYLGGLYHVLAYEGSKRTRRGRDADVYTIQATGLRFDDPRATPQLLESAHQKLLAKASDRLGPQPTGRDDL